MQGRTPGTIRTLLCVALLAGCAAGAPAERVSDPVIAGTRYAGTPIDLGAVKMHLLLVEGASPQNVRLSLGLLAVDEAARVVLSRATLASGGKAAEWVTRNAAAGSADGCATGGGAVLATDYWFNATVAPDRWNCVTLGFLLPGRAAGEALELRIESLNVDGEVVRTLPVSFAPRAPG